jgi:hypothetical protein
MQIGQSGLRQMEETLSCKGLTRSGGYDILRVS